MLLCINNISLNNDYTYNKEYFNKFYKIDLNQTSACVFYNYLININLNNWNHKKIFMINIKKKIIKFNKNYTKKILLNIYNKEYKHDLL